MATLVTRNALVVVVLDGPLEVVSVAAMIPTMTPTISKRRKILLS